jgi:hypothetical protein
LAPRPTNSDWSAVLLVRLTGSSLPSAATVARTVYRPLTAGQVPRFTPAPVAPALMVPVNVPVSVRTVPPLPSSRVSVTACPPPAEAIVPWLRMATVKVTVLPAAGVPGDHVATGTRSELSTGRTTSGLPAVKELLVSLVSMTVLPSSTFALRG